MSCLAATLAVGGYRAAVTTCCEVDPMPPTCADDRVLRLAKGAHTLITVTVYDETDTLVDLTDHAMSFRVKTSLDAAAAAINKTVGSGITILAQSGDTLGQAEIDVAPADLVALTPGVLVYEIRVTEPAPGSRIHSVRRPSDLVLEAEV